MEPYDVLQQLRNILDDAVQGYLWSDDELVSFLRIGYREFAKDTRTLTDMSTAGVATYTVPAGSSSIAVSDKLIDIIRAVNVESNSELTLENSNTMPLVGIPSGIIRALIADREKGKIHFYPVPAADTNLTLQVVRYPLENFDLSMTNPLEYQDHLAWRAICHYAAHLAYLKDDVEVQDLVKVDTMLRLYREQAMQYELDHKILTRTVGTVQYGGY